MFDSERPALAFVALAVGVAAVFPGFLLGAWAVLLIPTGTALLPDSPLAGLGLLVAALLLALALPVGAIWLGHRTRHLHLVGRLGWLLGWVALGMIVLAAIALYTIAPAYFRYE